MATSETTAASGQWGTWDVVNLIKGLVDSGANLVGTIVSGKSQGTSTVSVPSTTGDVNSLLTSSTTVPNSSSSKYLPLLIGGGLLVLLLFMLNKKR
jgi:hypothetical protein